MVQPLRIVIAAAFTALVAQFLLSGVQKLVNTRSCDDAKMLERLFGDRCPFNVSLLLLAGAWEVAASVVVLFATYTDSHHELRRYALASLVAFTLLATAMFKVWPRVKYYGLISNLSVAGGLAVAATL